MAADDPRIHDVAAGLGRPQKEISPKYFYDHRGSELFAEITRLPEYYPTRVERRLLREFAPTWIPELAPRALVELGAGAADKTRVLLDALETVPAPTTYVPIDISAEFLEGAADELRAAYPGVQVSPVVADFSHGLPDLPDLPRPAVFAFLGGTIGNFRPERATELLGRIARRMAPADRLLIGVDLVKPVDILERAYNDAAGVTAEFNLNALRVLNRELGADFDVDAFKHRAFYDSRRHRIEMHLVASRPMLVSLPGAGPFPLAEGESIRTEISCKYDRSRTRDMLGSAGLSLEEWVVGDPGFALATARLA